MIKERPVGATHICNSSEGKLYCKYEHGAVLYFDKYTRVWSSLVNLYLKDNLRPIRGEEYVDEVNNLKAKIDKLESDLIYLKEKLEEMYE